MWDDLGFDPQHHIKPDVVTDAYNLILFLFSTEFHRLDFFSFFVYCLVKIYPMFASSTELHVISYNLL